MLSLLFSLAVAHGQTMVTEPTRVVVMQGVYTDDSCDTMSKDDGLFCGFQQCGVLKNLLNELEEDVYCDDRECGSYMRWEVDNDEDLKNICCHHTEYLRDTYKTDDTSVCNRSTDFGFELVFGYTLTGCDPVITELQSDSTFCDGPTLEPTQEAVPTPKPTSEYPTRVTVMQGIYTDDSCETLQEGEGNDINKAMCWLTQCGVLRPNLPSDLEEDVYCDDRECGSYMSWEVDNEEDHMNVCCHHIGNTSESGVHDVCEVYLDPFTKLFEGFTLTGCETVIAKLESDATACDNVGLTVPGSPSGAPTVLSIFSALALTVYNII